MVVFIPLQVKQMQIDPLVHLILCVVSAFPVKSLR